MSTLDEETKRKVEEEMLPFLTPTTRPDVKGIALGFFLGLTGKPEGIAFIKDNSAFLEAVVALTSDDNQDIVKDSFRCLLNLASDEDISWSLFNMKRYPKLCLNLLMYFLDRDSQFADLVGGTLSNMSRTHRCALKLADAITEHRADVGVDKLVDALCNLDYNKNATMDSVGLLLSNLTQIDSFRHELMDKNRCIMQKLVPFTDFRGSHLKRGGIVGTLKNCCFEIGYHDWLLGDQVDLLPRLLLPLAGPEELAEDDMERLPDDLQYLPPEKIREPDPDIRKMLVEAIMQLCSTKRWRLHMKEKNVYVIMRELHKWETEPGNAVAIQNLIDLLIGDEPAEGMGDLSKVQVPERLQKEFEQAQPGKLKDAEDALSKME